MTTETAYRHQEAAHEEAGQQEEQHFHHWRIEEPNGPVSQGVCKLCGETREFQNWSPDGDLTTNTERRIAA